MISWTLLVAAAILILAIDAEARDFTLKNGEFLVTVGGDTGGISSLKRIDDAYDTDYVWDGKVIGDVVTTYRLPGGPWQTGNTYSSSDVRSVAAETPVSVAVSYRSDSSDPNGLKAFTVEESYSLRGDSLIWTIRLKNRTSAPVEIGDLGLPLLFATDYRPDGETIFTKRVIRHSFISGDNSFVFCERPSGIGPYLVMTPLPRTRLEYYTDRKRDETTSHRDFTAYVHAAVQANVTDAGSTWRQPITSLTLAPAGLTGDEVSYGFKFTWTGDYDGVRKALVRDGLVDVHAVPGMVIPRGMPAMFSLTTRQPIVSIEAEFPEETTIKFAGSPQPDTRVYRVGFARLGENRLTVNYGDGAHLYLEFFSTEPVETLIKKRADFLVRKQQWKGTGKWYDGLFSIWDMGAKVLRSPDDTGGLRDYMVGGSDDPSNGKAPYIALKNVSFPVQSEIDAVEYHLKHFVWGGLQRKDTETPYPYGIYGIDNWFKNRNSSEQKDQDHLWRSFDYPALFTLYHSMYQIAKRYPGMTKYLDAKGYLDRAFGTAKAFFAVPYGMKAWWGEYPDWSYTTSEYNEVCLPELIDDLYAEGRDADAYWLKCELEKKVKYFVYDNPYPYGSEYPFDSTAFETTHVLAKYGLTHALKADHNLWQDKNSGQWYSHPSVKKADFHAFMERQMAANIADRGWLEPSYYLSGSDIRGGGTAHYLLSYMAQMGGWSVLDYALNFSSQRESHMELGYASYLSSWAVINAGDAASNYGYWFPGVENDGAAGWAYEPLKVARPWYGLKQGRGIWAYDGEIDHGFLGGLRSAATIVVNDPIFGLFAYGGGIAKTPHGITVTPMDGLRQRFHMLTLDPPLGMELNQDGFIDIKVETSPDGTPSLIAFTLENRRGTAHETEMMVSGLPAGDYDVAIGRSRRPLGVAAKAETRVNLGVPSGKQCKVTITRTPGKP